MTNNYLFFNCMYIVYRYTLCLYTINVIEELNSTLLMDSNSTVDQDNILLEEVDTFLFNMPSEFALGHCVSKDMRMSAGIALNFKLVYKSNCFKIVITMRDILNVYKINYYFRSTFGRIGELMDQKCSVGNVAYLKHNGRFVYYLITKERCYFKPTYDTITAAINYLRDLIVKHDVKKLAIPRIGCGLDKLHWPTVKDIIEKAFKGVECNIKVCHFTEVCTVIDMYVFELIYIWWFWCYFNLIVLAYFSVGHLCYIS